LPRKFGVAPAGARSRSRSHVALRWTIHLLARFAITATWTSSAAALDAEHVLAAAGAVAGRSHAQEIRATDVEQSRSPSYCRPTVPSPFSQSAIAAQSHFCRPFYRSVE